MPTFGDSLKSNIIYSSCTPRLRHIGGGQALLVRDSLPYVYDVSPNGTAMASRAISSTSTHLWDARHPAPSRLWRPAGLRGYGVGVCRRTRAGSLYRPIAWGPHKATAEEIEARPAKVE